MVDSDCITLSTRNLFIIVSATYFGIYSHSTGWAYQIYFKSVSQIYPVLKLRSFQPLRDKPWTNYSWQQHNSTMSITFSRDKKIIRCLFMPELHDSYRYICDLRLLVIIADHFRSCRQFWWNYMHWRDNGGKREFYWCLRDGFLAISIKRGTFGLPSQFEMPFYLTTLRIPSKQRQFLWNITK